MVSELGSRTLDASGAGAAFFRSTRTGLPPPAIASAVLRALIAPYAVPSSATLVRVSGSVPSDSSKQ